MPNLKERLKALKDAVPISFARGANSKEARENALKKEAARKKRIADAKRTPKRTQKNDRMSK